MFGLSGAAKWISIAVVVTTIGGGIAYGINKIENAYDTAIAQAEDRGKDEVRRDQQKLIDEREKELRALAAQERAELEARVRAERAKVNDLRRMLLIDHDLDRLLQEKPGLILPRVNRGTEQIIKDLEELTQ